MNLDELKQQIGGVRLEEIDGLKKEIKNLKEKLTKVTTLNEQLQNRCWVISQGIVCNFCGLKDKCSPWIKSRDSKKE